ncbi:MAG: MATE family efflux transporter [Oscillospiraceae bacterium]|nr:MATE family efflux transporter [Oscillospiraceae bacterium]
MNKKSLINNMTEGSIAKQLIMFSLPLMLSNLLQTVYNMVDMIVIGQFVGKESLSAVSIGGDVLMTLTFVSMGLFNSGQILISQYVGAQNKKQINRTIGTLFTVVLISAIVLTVICAFIVNPILSWLNTPEEAWSEAWNYVFTCVIGLIFIYGYNVVGAILRGMGNSKQPLIFVAIAATTNLVFDLVFVVVFKWQAFGTALATVMGQAVSFIFSLIYLYKHKDEFGFDFKLSSFKPDKSVCGVLVKLGIPMCLQSAAISFSMIFVSSFINSYGVVAVAVTGVGNRFTHICSVVAMAISTSSSSVIGQCVGANKQERVPRTIGISLAICGAFSLLLILITVIWPEKVFGIFNSEPEVIEMALTYVPCAVFTFIGFALRAPMFGLINGVGSPTLNLGVGIFDGVVCRIGLSILLGVTCGLGIEGFWMGSCFAGYAPFVVGFIFFLSGKWRHIKLIKE